MSNIGGVIKSIRDIFRKDRGLNGDAQRIEQLGWMIFLKLFDDKDKEKELMNDKYKSPIPKKYQWRNWAADDEGLTGDELIKFIEIKGCIHGDFFQITIAQVRNLYLKITTRQIIKHTKRKNRNAYSIHHTVLCDCGNRRVGGRGD